MMVTTLLNRDRHHSLRLSTAISQCSNNCWDIVHSGKIQESWKVKPGKTMQKKHVKPLISLRFSLQKKQIRC